MIFSPDSYGDVFFMNHAVLLPLVYRRMIVCCVTLFNVLFVIELDEVRALSTELDEESKCRK